MVSDSYHNWIFKLLKLALDYFNFTGHDESSDHNLADTAASATGDILPIEPAALVGGNETSVMKKDSHDQKEIPTSGNGLKVDCIYPHTYVKNTPYMSFSC